MLLLHPTATTSQDMQLVVFQSHPLCCLEPMFSKAHPAPHQEAAFPLWEGVSHQEAGPCRSTVLHSRRKCQLKISGWCLDHQGDLVPSREAKSPGFPHDSRLTFLGRGVPGIPPGLMALAFPPSSWES